MAERENETSLTIFSALIKFTSEHTRNAATTSNTNAATQSANSMIRTRARS